MKLMELHAPGLVLAAMWSKANSRVRRKPAKYVESTPLSSFFHHLDS